MDNKKEKACVQGNVNAPKEGLKGLLSSESKLKMASSQNDSVFNENISTGVKAKLHKWIGKASKTVRDKRAGKEISAEIADSKQVSEDVINTLTPQHSRSRSAPIAMPDKEKVSKKARKGSVNFPPTAILRDDIARENQRNRSYPNNGVPQVFITPSVRLHESSIAPSSVQELQNQNAADNSAEETLDNTAERKDTASINGMNGLKINQGVPESQAKRKVFTRNRSKTSVDLCALDGSTENGTLISAVSLDSIPKDVQQLSGQIQSRLQMWVERASYLAAENDRRHSEGSTSSTDDGTNTPDSSRSSENENQMKKIKELELALKELVGNVGVRGGSVSATKLQDLSSNSPSSSSTNRSRNSSEGLGSDQGYGEFNENENDDVTEQGTRDARKFSTREGRYSSSSSSESDTVIKVTETFDRQPEDREEEDLDGIIFMKSSCSTRHSSTNYNPRERKSVTLQDVLISETLIEDTPKKGKGAKKMAAPKNRVTKNDDDTALQRRTPEACSEIAERKPHSSGTMLTEEKNENQTSSKTPLEETPSLKDGILRKKPVRPKLRRQAMSSDWNSNLAVRDSMRQYLNFKDADLSAFAVECVRHANKKKQITREEDQPRDGTDGQNTNLQKTFVNTKDTQVAGAIEQKPVVVLSPQDTNEQSDGAKGSSDEPKLEDAHSSESLSEGNQGTDDTTTASQTASNNFLARTVEEAEQVLASSTTTKEPLEQSSGNQPQDIGSNSTRLYKFPSMPMFYVPDSTQESDSEEHGKKKQEKRRSVTLFAATPHEPVNNEGDPFYREQKGPIMKSKIVSSSSISNLTYTDENGNVNKQIRKSPRPKMKARKFSAPSNSFLYSMTPTVRVDIEALI